MAAGLPTLGSTCGERPSGEPHQLLSAAVADEPGRALQGPVAPQEQGHSPHYFGSSLSTSSTLVVWTPIPTSCDLAHTFVH